MIPLSPIDLSSATVGSTGSIQLGQLAVGSAIQGGSLLICNESGCGLQLNATTSGNGLNLPAGGWCTFQIAEREIAIQYSVLYVLPNAQIAQLLVTYCAPNEPFNIPTLGNSPVGIGNSVPLNASATSVANDGNPSGTSILESTVSGDTASAVSLTNNGDLILGSATNPGSFLLTSGKIGRSAVGDILDASGNDTTIKTVGGSGTLYVKDGAGNTLAYCANSTGFTVTNGINLTTGRLKELATGTVTTSGTATVNHGLSGTPFCVLCDTSTASSSATTSTYNYTATQFTLLNGSGSSMTFRWFAYR